MNLKFDKEKFIKSNVLRGPILGAVLMFVYCIVYGLTAQLVFTGIQLLFFFLSIFFALSVMFIREPDIQKEKIKKGILFNQITGTALAFLYLAVFGVSSFALLNGFQLIFFMSSYTFAMSVFYLRDPERIKKEEEISSSITSPFVEKNPCFINNQDLSWLVRDLNASLSSIVGFSELMLNRDFSESEKEYMLRSIHEKAISIASTVSKASNLIPDSLTNPIHNGKITGSVKKEDSKL